MGLKEEELQPLVTAWRNSNPNIVKFWWAVDNAVMTVITERTSAETHGLKFACKSGMLFITLPSGRKLAYTGLLEQGKIFFVKPIFAVTAEINIGKSPPAIGKHKFRNKGMGFNYFDFDFAAGISFNLGKGDAGKFRRYVSSGQVQRTNMPRIGSPEITPDTRALILFPEKINRCRCGDKHKF